MASLDSLAPDQRAVLQMVLQRGRTYDQIAKLLGIDRAAVRQRALDAFDALGPDSSISDIERGLLTDYLLSQLPPKVETRVHDTLAGSPPQRAWARVIASEIAPLAATELPEIPAAVTRRPEPEPEPEVDDPQDEDAPAARAPWEETAAEAAGTEAAAPRAAETAPVAAKPSSRRGGAILLAALAVIIVIAVVVVVIVSNSGGSSGNSTTKSTAASAATTPASTSTGTSTTATGTGTSTTAATPLKQLNLVSPTGAKKTVGIVDVVRQGKTIGMVLLAQGLTANTTHNAYDVWLWSTKTNSGHWLGFYSQRVAKTGKMEAAVALPSNATSYDQVLVTLQTVQKPTKPGTIVLQGSFSE
jgi:hypothetical protein